MSTPAAQGYAVSAGQGVAGRAHNVKASGEATAGALTVMEIEIDDGPPRHTHTHEDESLYVFTGTLDIECGHDRFRAEPGAFAYLPRGIPHRFHSLDGPATALLIVTPGGLDEYFAELHSAMKTGDPNQIRKVQQAYGIEVA
jgi:quercetin dioxygenase-like cupin family protein